MTPLPLYPSLPPTKTGMMNTHDGYSIYWEISGNLQGIPVVFLHGGPGSGTYPWQRTFFNPALYQIILFDQRGSGKSTPHASLSNNDTSHILADMEQLRQMLGVKKWVLFGGSWGSTVALAYVHKYPESVLALVLYGIFLAREKELRDLYYQGGLVSHIFPDIFSPYMALLSDTQKQEPIKGYAELFRTSDASMRHQAIVQWTRLEKRLSKLTVSDEELSEQMQDLDYVVAHSLIENHYFLHNGFIKGDDILKTIGTKTAHIPVHIVQGRYDMVCPFMTAYELHAAISHSKLHVIEDVGHTAREPKMQEKLVTILDMLAEKI